MAISLLQLLGGVLGGPNMAPQGQSAPQAVGAVAPPMPGQPVPVAPSPDSQAVQPDIQVNAAPVVPPSLRQGIAHGGTFGLGHTGGNILGMIGDAFLTQAGHAPQYAPRLQLAREAEALQDFQQNPVGALQKYGMINPQDMLHQTDVMHDNNRQQAASDSIIADNAQNRALKTRGVLAGMANAVANAKDPKAVWPGMISQMQRYADANDFNDPLPDSPENAGTWAQGSESVGDQEKNRAMAAWRQAQEGLRQQQIDNTKAYHTTRAAQFDRALGYQGQKTDHTVNAPLTPTQISGILANKVQSGVALNPNEQKTWNMLHPPRAAKAGGFKVVNGQVVRQ